MLFVLYITALGSVCSYRISSITLCCWRCYLYSSNFSCAFIFCYGHFSFFFSLAWVLVSVSVQLNTWAKYTKVVRSISWLLLSRELVQSFIYCYNILAIITNTYPHFYRFYFYLHSYVISCGMYFILAFELEIFWPTNGIHIDSYII